MRFDDRLATVMRLPVGGDGLARNQWRQLVDLLGTAPVTLHGPPLDTAYARLAEISARLSPRKVADILAEPGMRLRSPRLVAALAAGDPRLAQAALARAELSAEQWLDLIPALSAQARGLLARRGDLPEPVRALLARLGAGVPALDVVPLELVEATELKAAPAVPAPADSSPPPETAAPAADGIGAIVRRIEAFRRAREFAPTPIDSPRLPMGEEPGAAEARITSFDFASDARGRIVWADARLAPMVVGTSLAALAGGPAGQLATAISHHQPVRAATIALSGAAALAGEWQLDAAPRFDSAGGRFTGHIGRLRRPAHPPETAPDAPATTHGEGERLRQMLHELRTPVNAIQGFAEVIQQQLFGPTPHEYRALAASIAGDAARMLAGFEELERHARLDSGALAPTPGASDLAACIASTMARLSAHLERQGGGFTIDAGATPAMMVALDAAETEMLCWRLLAALAASAGPGEALAVELGRMGGAMAARFHLPALLATLDDEALFHAAAPINNAGPTPGMFGVGFALRLAAGEARAAGGALRREGNWLCLTLPGLTEPAPDHSAVERASATPARPPAA